MAFVPRDRTIGLEDVKVTDGALTVIRSLTQAPHTHGT